MEQEFSTWLRGLLREALPPEPRSLQQLGAVLGELTAAELATRLQDQDDPEAQPMRELLLFPDAAMARAVEHWLLTRQQTPAALDAEAVAATLEGAQVVIALGQGVLLELELEPAEAAQLVLRLHPGTPAPAEVRDAVLKAAADLGVNALEDDNALAVLARCRRARLEWTPARTRFIARLIQGLARGVPGRGADEKGVSSRLLEAVDWCVPFLQHAGDDLGTELAMKRTELLERLQQALREEKMREKHNFETRRMLGMAESFAEPELVRQELALVDDIARATGGLPLNPHSQVVHHDLEDVGSVESVEDMQRLLGLLGGE